MCIRDRVEPLHLGLIVDPQADRDRQGVQDAGGHHPGEHDGDRVGKHLLAQQAETAAEQQPGLGQPRPTALLPAGCARVGQQPDHERADQPADEVHAHHCLLYTSRCV